MRNLEGRTAVITGASSGIGFALAEHLAAAGMQLVIASQNENRLKTATGALSSAGATVVSVPTNVADESDVKALAQRALAEFGAVHLLVNNAGVFAPGYIWDIAAADWSWVVGVNLWGPVYGLRHFLPILLEQEEGHVVNVSSAAGLISTPAHGPYCTTKHAIVGLSKALRDDLRLRGANVGVTCVCPGAVATDITSQPTRTGPSGRPAERAQPASEVERAWVSLVDYTNSGITAERAASQIVDAVKANDFWVLPNVTAVEARICAQAAEIEAAMS
jgi:NAD(P)-dependent dehydrogenase (short-subunit alcohol dehydrogenase family)